MTATAGSGIKLQDSFPELTHDRKNRYSCVEKAKILLKLNLYFFSGVILPS
jgi:hypothetical protein